MASKAKRKPAAKRTAKKTVRTQSRQAEHVARAAKSAWNATQRSANQFTGQSAKLYALPDVGEATRQATEQMQSATESMMRAGSDMLQQVWGKNPFGQLPSAEQFTGKAQAHARNAAHEGEQQFNRAANHTAQAVNEALSLSRENAEAAVECGNIAITVSKEIGAEIMSYANRTFAQNVELSKEVLSCRTLNDMFDLSSKMVKNNLDNFFSESVRVSEMLFQCATDVSEPLNSRVSDTTERLTKAMAA